MEVPIPELGAESIVEGGILSIAKGVGDYVAAEEMVAEIETGKQAARAQTPVPPRLRPLPLSRSFSSLAPYHSPHCSLARPVGFTDKVTIEAKSPAAGTIKAIHVEVGQTVEVGSKFFALAVGQGEPSAAAAPKAEAAPAAAAPAAAAPPPPPPPKPAAAAAAASPTAAAEAPARETRVAMTRLRKRISQRLKESQDTTAMLTTFNEVDMSALTNLRTEYKDAFLKKHDTKLGFMSPFVAASAAALQENPLVNAIIDGDDIVYRDYVDISIAVSAPKGLVTPVLRGVQDMTWADIEREIVNLGTKAKTNALTVEDLAGGTFSITNGGVFGSLLSTPIINIPQSAILGMHGIFPRPVAVKGEVVIRPMMYIALTYDHRLIDGREAVTFLKRVKELTENPARFALGC